MKLIGASIILPCDIESRDSKDFQVIKNGGIVFDNDRIIEIDDFQKLEQKYKKITESRFYKNHILLPALINSHIHFEFSKNDSSFVYGDFGSWLNSVMDNRGAVLRGANAAIKRAIKEQLNSGVGSVCAISSYDLDLQFLLDSKLKVIFCHEVIGALEANFNAQKASLDSRLKQTLSLKNKNFQPAIAIHSPYSVNFKLANYAVNLAKKHNLLLSAHFLESKCEFEWLTRQSGYFREFFTRYFGLQNTKPGFSIESFLTLFNGCKAIFTHCLYADNSVRKGIYKQGNAIISCPRSNLLLNAKMGENTIIATDGKSSNNDVNLLNEARSALFCSIQNFDILDFKNSKNHNLDSNFIESICQNLILAMTSRPAKALNLNNGMLKVGKSPDLAIFKIESKNDFVATNFILNAKKVTRLIINGQDCL
ncbi:metal-dependent hydrolase [Helicobacter saguini]|uniref:Metal-dependent hydrolase n=1 Tax=Helicobacter saguini TaxID=1548018 RepID=A0A347W5P3_9HELI|nr:aminofutalosine deaminase family hydrolase [Helicobacter saguini]MWV61356.1 metal-dependent hydrolase [Helicobacter saguini]MWV67974.1 metal-dependent hydrolase [Helicobacter saguini]MWV70558.1 metal-dependent hydrolase [Helicobacter saguini]MWV72462.1 metal-dependent hydrolase [Helicobacter saguini]TLD94783.1 metal-dependent hydrolase [Helicobacter saguini]